MGATNNSDRPDGVCGHSCVSGIAKVPSRVSVEADELRRARIDRTFRARVVEWLYFEESRPRGVAGLIDRLTSPIPRLHASEIARLRAFLDQEGAEGNQP